jgi:predicted dehydrogenase
VELELHFSPQYRYARKLAQEGKFGDIKSIYLSNISLSPIIYFPNWGEPELSYGKTIPIRPGDKICRGGALTDHPHPFDMIHWITGAEFKKIYAISGKNQRDYLKVEDHVAITGQLDNGAIFFINPSYSHIEEKVNTRRLYWPKSLEVNLKINGSRGYYATDFCDKHIYILGSGYVSPNRLMVQGAGKAKRDPHDNMLDSFALSVQGEREVESSLEDGLRAVKAMNAAYESLYRGEAVEL